MRAASSKFIGVSGVHGKAHLLTPAALFLAGMCVHVPGIAQGPRTQAVHAMQLSMREHYEAAFRFQSSGRTAQADEEYKLYLGMVLHEIANGRASLGDYRNAVPLYEDALRLHPDDPDVEMDYAAAALDASDWTRAESLTSAVLDLRQRNGLAPDAGALDELARAQLELGKHQDALHAFKLAADLKPSADSFSKLASAYLVLGDKSGATRIFDQIVISFGDTAALRMEFGSLYGAARFFDAAITEFNKAIAMDSHLKGAHYSLGATYMMQRGAPGFNQAEGEFRKELAIDPDDALVYMALGRIALTQNRLAEAEADLKRALEGNQQSASIYLTLGHVYQQMGRNSDAEAAFRKSIALTLDPSKNNYDVEQAHFWLGRLLVEGGHTAEGHQELDISRNLLYLKEQQVQSRLSGKAMLQMPLERTHAGNPTQLAALRTFEKQAAPVIASSYHNLAVNEANSGDFSIASQDFEQAAKWNPALDGIDENWGRAAFAAKNYGSAVAPLSRALNSHPENERTRALLGLSLFMTRDYARALDVLRPIEAKQSRDSAVAIAWEGSMALTEGGSQGLTRLKVLETANPDAPIVHYLLGVAYAKTDDFIQSANELDVALKLDPASRDAMAALAQTELALGHKTAALQLYSQLAESGSRDGETFHQLARLQMELGLSNAAISTLETAIRLNPMDAGFHAELADAYRKCSQPDEAESEAVASETIRAENEFSRTWPKGMTHVALAPTDGQATHLSTASPPP